MKQVHDQLYEDLKNALKRNLNDVLVSGLKRATRLNQVSGKFELHKDYVNQTMTESELILFETVGELFQDIKVSVYEGLNEYTDILMRGQEKQANEFSDDNIDIVIEEIEKKMEKDDINDK